MADQKGRPPKRGPIASQFDVMTMALAVIMLCVAACSVLAIGPVEALGRVASGVGDLVDGLTALPAR